MSGRTLAVDPMGAGDIREFHVDSSKKETCQLRQDNYYVKKDYCHDHPVSESPSMQPCDCKGNDCDVFFYASIDNKFEMLQEKGKWKMESYGKWEKEDATLVTERHRYRNDIGYIKCHKGFIDLVAVNDDKDCMWIPARNCGIAPILTSLCMVDPELDMLPDSGLEQYFVGKYGTELISDIKIRCRRFVGLIMDADPLKGAYAYFSAALKSGYKKILIGDNYNEPKEWMSIKNAKEAYDSKTGKIGEIVGKNKIWWFCDEVEG